MDYSKKEQEYKNTMTRLRSEADNTFDQLHEKLNSGQISEQEYKQIEFQIKSHFDGQRKEMLVQRDKDLADAELSYYQRLADSKDVRDLRGEHAKVKKMQPHDLESYYNDSLRFNDKQAAQACALVAAERGDKKILNDYSERNQGFSDILREYGEFQANYKNPDKRIQEMLTDYRNIDPPRVKRKSYQVGYTVNDRGMRVPYFRDRVIKK